MAALLGVELLAGAADLYRNAPSGNWSTAANWGGTLPGTGDNAWITNGGTATITKSGEVCGSFTWGPAPEASK